MDTPGQIIEQARLRLQQGRAKDARTLCLQALRLSPHHLPGLLLLGGIEGMAGNFKAAHKAFAQALAQAPSDATVLFNLGLCAQHLRRPIEARRRYEQAIAARPDFAEAHSNLAATLKDLGLNAEAIARYREALHLKPDDADTHQSLGRALHQLGRPAEAIVHFERALGLRPDDVRILVHCGLAQADNGEPMAALACYERALARGDHDDQALHAMSALLRGMEPSGSHADVERLARAVERCLAAPRNDHQSLARIGLHLAVRPEAERWIDAWCARPAPETDETDVPPFAEPIFQEIFDDSIFRLVMRRAIIADMRIERFLTRLRGALLGFAMAGPVNAGHRDRAESVAHLLAVQSFLNEYVWAVEPRESAALAVLRAEAQTLAFTDPDHELRVLVLAAYERPGDQPGPAGWPERLRTATSARLRDLCRLTVETFATEVALADEMPTLTPIAEGTSRRVQAQYEAYPYPRWQSLPRAKPAPFTTGLRQAIWPHRPAALPEIAAPRILVAGCGTGHQAALTASRYENASVLAIDLSRASLAYAERMARDLEITNIRFAQGDILDLDRVGETFDVVECIGVLHHLERPADGLAKLVAATRPGGFVRIGLYSKASRRDIDALRQRLGATPDQAASPAEIRALRGKVIGLVEAGFDPEILETLDFYSTSMVKDLLFHVCEHSFTIPELEALMRAAGLAFLGFDLADRSVKRDYLARNPSDPQAIALPGWAAFEAEHPRTFRGMYVLWARRVESDAAMLAESAIRNR